MSAQAQGVLVTDGDERSALAATRALGRRGIPVYVGADSSTSLAACSRYCTRAFQYPSPWKNPQDYVACILDVVKRFRPSVLLPMTDVAVELIGEHCHEFNGIVSIPIPSASQYRQLSDKYQLTDWATRNGVPVPETLFLPDGACERVVDRITQWPVVVKPGASLIKVNGFWAKTSVHIARSVDELLHLYRDRWYLRNPSIIQRRIIGDGQGVFGLYSRGEPQALFAHRRIREKPPSGGVSVLRESIPLPRPMTDYALKILGTVHWQGVAMVEFKVDRETGVPYLMEVNGRFWGSLQLAIDSGVDFPFLTYQLATMGRVESGVGTYRVGVKSRWFLGDLDQLLLRLRKSHKQLGLPPGSPNKLQALWDFLAGTDRQTKSEVFRLDDSRPAFYEAGLYLRQLSRTVSGSIAARTPDIGVLGAKGKWVLLKTLGFQNSWLRKFLPRPIGTVLILCKGNVCRSPFAAEFLRQRSRQLGAIVEVVSAGFEAESGREAYPLARQMAERYGVSLSAHRTMQLSPEMVAAADLILVMDSGQAKRLRQRYPVSTGKVFLLGNFGPGLNCDIRDPYGGTPKIFTQCYDQISKACEKLLPYLTRTL